MSETAAAAPATDTSTAAPSAAEAAATTLNPANAEPAKATTEREGESAEAKEAKAEAKAEKARERRRIALAELDDDDEIVSVIDGKERVETAAEHRRRTQSDVAATERFQAASKLRKETEQMQRQFTEALSDPRRLRAELVALGYSPGQVAEALYAAEQEELALTPEQRRIRELEAETQRYLAQQKQQQEQHYQRQVEAYNAQYQRFADVAIRSAGIPDHPEIRERAEAAIYAEIQRSIDAGRSLKPADAARVAKEAYSRIAAGVRASLSKEERLALIDDEVFEAAQKARVGRAPTIVQPTPGTNGQPRADDGKFASEGPRIIQSYARAIGVR